MSVHLAGKVKCVICTDRTGIRNWNCFIQSVNSFRQNKVHEPASENWNRTRALFPLTFVDGQDAICKFTTP